MSIHDRAFKNGTGFKGYFKLKLKIISIQQTHLRDVDYLVKRL